MRTCWRSELLALGSLDWYEAGELRICVQGRINCASETGPGAYLVPRLTFERILCGMLSPVEKLGDQAITLQDNSWMG